MRTGLTFAGTTYIDKLALQKSPELDAELLNLIIPRQEIGGIGWRDRYYFFGTRSSNELTAAEKEIRAFTKRHGIPTWYTPKLNCPDRSDAIIDRFLRSEASIEQIG